MLSLQSDGLLLRVFFFSSNTLTSIAQVATQIKYCLTMREKICCVTEKHISGNDYV